MSDLKSLADTAKLVLTVSEFVRGDWLYRLECDQTKTWIKVRSETGYKYISPEEPLLRLHRTKAKSPIWSHGTFTQYFDFNCNSFVPMISVGAAYLRKAKLARLLKS